MGLGVLADRFQYVVIIGLVDPFVVRAAVKLPQEFDDIMAGDLPLIKRLHDEFASAATSA